MNCKIQLKESDQQSSSRSPQIFRKQFFITHLNLSSSSSFKKFKKNSPDTIKPYNINSRIKQTLKFTQQEKTIKINSVDTNEQVMSFTSSQNQKKSQNQKSSLTSRNKFGQWIKPKASKIKDQYLLKYQRKKKEIGQQKQHPSIKNESQPQGIHNQKIFQLKQFESLSSHNESKECLQQNQSDFAQQGTNEQFNQENFDKQKYRQLYFEQPQKSNNKQIPDKLSYSLNLTSSHSSNLNHQLLSTNKTQRGSIFSQLSPTQANKKYSKFKTLLQEQNSKIQKSIPQRFPSKQKVTHQPHKHLGSFSPKQLTEEINCNEQKLLPSHFSYKSQNNYLQNYRIYAGNPQKLMRSMNDLRKINDEEHEYFKYERMQKQLMYYKNNLGQSSPMTQRSFIEVSKDVEMARRVKYDNFIKELQNKMSNCQIDCYTPVISITSEQLNDLQSSQSDLIELEENQYSAKQMANNQTVSCSNFIPQGQTKRYGKLQIQHKPQANESKSPTEQTTLQLNQNTILMFQKSKTKVKKLEDKLDRIKSQQRKFFLQFQQIGQQTSNKIVKRMQRLKSIDVLPKR